MSLLDEDIVIMNYNSKRQLKDGEMLTFTASHTAKLWFLLWLSFLVAILFIIIK
jgi:hypothetical protein